ncbi:hypothetical protein M3P19_11555, partial [Muricauda sp. 2012CJ35-5]|nr:hypothetical protein [Allomuricauda spongiicola]
MIPFLLIHLFGTFCSKLNLLRKYKLLILALFAFLYNLNGPADCSAQQVDTWFMADRAVNSPASPPYGQLYHLTPLPPPNGTPVTTWYDWVDYEEQNAILEPIGPYSAAFPIGYDYPFGTNGVDFLNPTGAIPGPPELRENPIDNINFNPVLYFDGNADLDGVGDALVFESVTRGETTVVIVFKALGAGNTAETQRLLYGGDVRDHPSQATNLSLGVSENNRFSVGRTQDTSPDFFEPGKIDTQGLPTIGVFRRDTLGIGQEELTTRVNGLPDISGIRSHPDAHRRLFPYNRIGAHFNSSDPNRNLSGSIAEIFALDGPLGPNEIQALESYLAIKYGITLSADPALTLGSTNGNIGYTYVSASGATIWDPNLNTLYRFDIAGIGKDRYDNYDGGDNSTTLDDRKLRYNLQQRISESSNIEARVTISTNNNFSTGNIDHSRTTINGSWFGSPKDYNYLLWGNDRGNINEQFTELVPGITSRIGREWQIQKTNFGTIPISDVSLQVDLNGSDILLNGNCDLFLLIDTDGDGDFTTGIINQVSSTSIVAGIAQFDGLTFEHTEVFTFGYGDNIPPTASNPPSITVCDSAPAPDPLVVTDEADNCGIVNVTHLNDTTDVNSNPETITRTYRVTDGANNFIDVLQLIYVYTTPSIDALADIEACDSFLLPPITGTNLTGNQAYYDAPDGGGNQYLPGESITASGILFIYDETGSIPNCSDQQNFLVTIDEQPVADAGADEQICGAVA